MRHTPHMRRQVDCSPVVASACARPSMSLCTPYIVYYYYPMQIQVISMEVTTQNMKYHVEIVYNLSKKIVLSDLIIVLHIGHYFLVILIYNITCPFHYRGGVSIRKK